MKRTSLAVLTQQGWTLTELLIAVAIIAIIAVLFLLTNWRLQILRGYDARRKADLANIRTAFEEYYNDHDCYPVASILNNCGGTDLAPYLAKIPCDPATRQPYLYVPVDENDLCRGYRVLTRLSDLNDPGIVAVGCDPVAGCGFATGYNWGVSSGVPVASGSVATPTATPTPAPTPTPGGGNYACTPGGQCNVYADPQAAGCPVTWPSGCPVGACDDPANRCVN